MDLSTGQSHGQNHPQTDVVCLGKTIRKNGWPLMIPAFFFILVKWMKGVREINYTNRVRVVINDNNHMMQVSSL